MTWNYRVLRRESNPIWGETFYYHAIYAVYYNGDKPSTCSKEPTNPYSEEGVDVLRADLQRMMEALDKPVLDYETLEEVD